MRRAILCLALLAIPAMADDMVMRGLRGAYVRLMDAPCADPNILAHIRPEHRAIFRQAIVAVSGETIPGCWAAHSGAVLVTFTDGSDIMLEQEKFKRESGI